MSETQDERPAGDYREPEVRARQAAADRFVRSIGGGRSRRGHR